MNSWWIHMGINKVQGNAALCSYDRLSTSDRFLIETTSRVGRLSKKKKNKKHNTHLVKSEFQRNTWSSISVFSMQYLATLAPDYISQDWPSLLLAELSQPQREHTDTLYTGFRQGRQDALLYFLRRAVSFTLEERSDNFLPVSLPLPEQALFKSKTHFPDPLITHLLKKKWKCSLIQVVMQIKCRNMCKA